jgi:hypothetical protein
MATVFACLSHLRGHRILPRVASGCDRSAR